ncbi:MAG: molybdate ABC transporter permease subunit [Planctomycetota bacterium]|jgi:molybdate transport system permease protein
MAAIDAFPIWLSLRVAAMSLVIVAPIGLALAWLQARKRYRFMSLVDALILLPLVLPPSVTGFYLVVIFGRRGPVGRFLESLFDLQLVFTPAAAVIASSFAAFPIMVKTAQPALEAVPPELEKVGRSLGLSSFRLFFRVALPHAWPGVLAALVLTFARAIGELGATLMFAGNIPGRTNTVPLEIFARFQQGEDRAAHLYCLFMVTTSLLIVMVATYSFRRREVA